MEKLYFEIPGVARKEDAVDYIREFHEYQSDINGTGGLDRFTGNYEGWLKKLEQDYDDMYAHCTVVDYNIDVKKALLEHPEFEEMILSIDDIF